MARALLTLPTDSKGRIHAVTILKYDVAWWLFSAALPLGIYLVVLSIVASARPDMDSMDVTSIMATTMTPFYLAMIVTGALLAQRSFSHWTWLLIAILFIGYFNWHGFSFATHWLPNSFLHIMVVMIGILALGRIIECFRMRYIAKYTTPTLSVVALGIYFAVILGAILLTSPIVYDFISN